MKKILVFFLTPILIGKGNPLLTELTKFKRPTTILIVGAQTSQLSMLAHIKQCTYVLSNNNTNERKNLLRLCKKNKYSNVILLGKTILPSELKRLSECEYFDIVLLMNPKREFGNSWEKACQLTSSLGYTTIINRPSTKDDNSSTTYNSTPTLEKIIIDYHPVHQLLRSMWLMPPITNKEAYPEGKGPYKIIVDHCKKILHKTLHFPIKHIVEVNWQHGINLMTFKMLQGLYPTVSDIKLAIKYLQSVPSNDWMPNNMVIQGKKIILIDRDDPYFNSRPIKAQLRIRRVLKLMEFYNPNDVKTIFFEHVVSGRSLKEILGDVIESKHTPSNE